MNQINDEAFPMLSFIGYRKHLVFDKKYHIKVYENRMTMGEDEVKEPKYIIYFSLLICIGWNLDRAGKLNSFSFPYKNVQKRMNADVVSLEKLMRVLACKVTFSKISDFYLAQNVIGKGSSAKVLLCKSFVSQINYAVKSIEKEYLKSEENGYAGFESEVNILRHLNKYSNENRFIKLHEIFMDETTYYLVMDLMEGRTLQEEMEFMKVQYQFQNKQNFRLFKPEIVRKILQQILLGLSIMHECQIIHRDLKPENLMFSKKGDLNSLRIVDFGLATLKTAERYLFPKCGTPGYVAPEVLSLKNREEKYSEVCDIFSAGVIFYKLLSGVSLFQGKQLKEQLIQNRDCKIDFDREDISHITPTQRHLLELMLQKNPKRRISAKQALNHQFISQQTLSATVLPTGPDSFLSPTKVLIKKFKFETDEKLKNTQEMNDNKNIDDLFEQSMEESNLPYTIKIKQLPQIQKPQQVIVPKLIIEGLDQVDGYEENDKDISSCKHNYELLSPQRFFQDKKRGSQKMTSFYMKDPLSVRVKQLMLDRSLELTPRVTQQSSIRKIFQYPGEKAASQT